MTKFISISFLPLICLLPNLADANQDSARSQTIVDGEHYLRSGDIREWSSFPEVVDNQELVISFESSPNDDEWTLELTHVDVKRNWRVLLNDQEISKLTIDENRMTVYIPVPTEMIRDGENVCRITCTNGTGTSSDDISIGPIELHHLPKAKLLSQSTIDVSVVGQSSRMGIPCRLTIVNARDGLQTVDTDPNPSLATRPGIVYTLDGSAILRLPAGEYTITAGRGFEYSIDQKEVSVGEGESRSLEMIIERVVDTTGYIACDTHTHTRTHSGHGDATVEERMITIAAEGIELPIATDHNVQIDQAPYSVEAGTTSLYTTVVGNEVTTSIGHFNIFPVAKDASVPDHRHPTWPEQLKAIFDVPGVQVAILNHARDLHSGYRPFGIENYLSSVGELATEWPIEFNGMEVINSAATQSDPLQLTFDWMGIINRGYQVTPVGSSDSHDVGRHFIGQGRTYIRIEDETPGEIDIHQAAQSFCEGQVLVSYGLIVELIVDNSIRSGDTANLDDEEETFACLVRVLGPSWVQADKVSLFANGIEIWNHQIVIDEQQELAKGVIFERRLDLPKPSHDVFLTAIASGPGCDELYWKAAKPYQPTSPIWNPMFFGCSGAIYLNADGDATYQCADDYATSLVSQFEEDPRQLLDALSDYDSTVSCFAAFRLQQTGFDWLGSDGAELMNQADEHVVRGLRTFVEQWRLHLQHRRME